MIGWLRSVLSRTSDLSGSDRVDAVALRMLSSLRRAKAKHPGDPVIAEQYRQMARVVEKSGRRP